MKRRERLLLFTMVAGLSLLLIMRDVFNIEFPKLIYAAYVIAFMAIAQYKTMIYMICFILPLVCGLPGTYIMPCALLFLVVKKKMVNVWQILMIVFVVLSELFASLWYPTVRLTTILQYVSFAGVMLFLIHDKTELDNLMCVRMYMLGVVLLCVTIITTGIMTAPNDWMKAFQEGHFRFGATQMDKLDGMKLTLNANSLAYYSITGIGCGLLLVEKTKKQERLFFLLCVFVAVIAGLLSVSRSWLLVIVIGVLLYIFSKVKYPKRFLISIVVLVAVLYGVYWILGGATEIMEAFIVRVNYENMESGGGRTDIIQKYMKLFWSDIRVVFFGSGVTQYAAVLGQDKSMHNGLQQILVCYGLPGFVFMLVALIKPVMDAKRNGKRSVTSWLPLIGIVLFVQTVQFLNPPMLMLPYIIGVYALKAGGVINEDLHHNSGHRRRQSVGLENWKGNHH